MKTVFVLVFLSTLSLSQAADVGKCKKATAWGSSPVTFEANSENCNEKVEVCSRPKWDGTKYAAADGANVIWGCGSCPTKASCVECSTADCNVEPTFKCKNSVANDASDTCPDGSNTKCYRPKIVDQAGAYATEGINWGCVACKNPENCVECTSSDCNVKPTATHKCLAYTKTGDPKVFGKSGAEVDCSDDLPGCKMPTPDNKATTWDPCGKCPDNDKTCKYCNDKASCNDIATGTRYCKAGAADAALDTLVSNFCASGDSDCTRPFVSYGKAVSGASVYGCGDCTGSADKTCVKCGESKKNDCNNKWKTTNVNCYTWTFSDKWTKSAAVAACNGNDDAEAKCSRPVYLAVKDGYTGNGCGPCPANSKTCKGFGDSLNKDGSHQCYMWEWNATDKKWKPSAQKGECDLPSDKKCSLPTDRSAEKGFTSDGCGKCKTGEEKACITTEPGLNWGQRVTVSLLAIVLPLFYVML